MATSNPPSKKSSQRERLRFGKKDRNLKKIRLYATLPLGYFIITIIFYLGGRKMKKSSFQIKREEIFINIIKLKCMVNIMFTIMVSTFVLCFLNKPIAVYNLSLAIFIFALIYFIAMPKISRLEKIEVDLIQRNKKIIFGKRRCQVCRKWFKILWPQQGGICSSCLLANYTIFEAKKGVNTNHYKDLEEMYMTFLRTKEMP